MSYILSCLKQKFTNGRIIRKIYDYCTGTRRTWLKKYRYCIINGHVITPPSRHTPVCQEKYGVKTFVLYGDNIITTESNRYIGGSDGLSYKRDKQSFRLWRLSTNHMWFF